MEPASWPLRRMRTWEDVGKPSPDVWWQYVRSLRMSPPGFARKGTRASVFRAALEQSEHLFQAAASVDYSARPILAYYALAQAALAVIQASPYLRTADASPNSHGMQWEPDEDGLGAVVDESAPRSTLSIAIRATNSGGIGPNPPINRLWNALPEPRLDLAHNPDPTIRPWLITGPRDSRHAEMHVGVGDVSLLKPDFDATLASLLHARPHFGEFNVTEGRAGPNWFTLEESGTATIYFPNVDVEHVDRILTMSNMYYDTRHSRLFASLDGNRPVHPLILWLAILFGLSMIARYHPERWAKLLNTDQSRYAPMLEDILQRANVVCPGLILNTLDHMGVLYQSGVRPPTT